LNSAVKNINLGHAIELLDIEIAKLDIFDAMNSSDNNSKKCPLDKVVVDAREAIERARFFIKKASKEIEKEGNYNVQWEMYYRRAIVIAHRSDKVINRMAVHVLQVILDDEPTE